MPLMPKKKKKSNQGKKKRRSGSKKGKVVGTMHRNGYKVTSIDKKQYPVHRLIWLYHHGFMPEKGIEIDHINRHRDDNRIENLRMVSVSCNQRNTGNWSTNTTGVKGVVIGNNKYRSVIRVYNKLYVIGEFHDFNEAVLHRLAAEQCLNWNECDSKSPAYQYAIKHKLIRRKYGNCAL